MISEHFRLTMPVVIVLIALAILCAVYKKRLTAFLEPKIASFLM